MSENEFETIPQASDTVRESDEEYEVIDVGALENRVVQLGRRGENRTQNVRIDASAMLTVLPGATLSIAAIRPQETEVYAPAVTVSDGVITWVITQTDVSTYGLGYAEVRATKGAQVKKSAVFRTRVEFGLV